jgi:predicted glycoside hydrolase/deacetylase ChbG (UPF0249 family)
MDQLSLGSDHRGQAAASLIDSCGHFWPSRASFIAHSPKIEEVEAEMRAQIERALTRGCGSITSTTTLSTIVETPELRELLEKLAKEYNLAFRATLAKTPYKGSMRYRSKKNRTVC